MTTPLTVFFALALAATAPAQMWFFNGRYAGTGPKATVTNTAPAEASLFLFLHLGGGADWTMSPNSSVTIDARSNESHYLSGPAPLRVVVAGN